MTDDIFLPDLDLSSVNSVGEFFTAIYVELADASYPLDPDTHYVTIPDTPIEISPHGDAFGPYSELRNYLLETDLTGDTPSDHFVAEAHHLLQLDFVKDFGLNVNEVASVALDRFDEDNPDNTHQFYSDALRNTLDTNSFYDIDELYDAHANLYSDSGHPDWANNLLDYISDNRDHLIGLYDRGDVPGSADPGYGERADRVIGWLRTL